MNSFKGLQVNRHLMPVKHKSKQHFVSTPIRKLFIHKARVAEGISTH